MGINVGAFAAPIAASITGIMMANAHAQQVLVGEMTKVEVDRAGYLAVFVMAAVGMLIGELIYLLLGRFARPVQSNAATVATADTAQRSPLISNADEISRCSFSLSSMFFSGWHSNRKAIR